MKLTENKLSAREVYERLQINFVISFLVILFVVVMTVMLSDMKSIAIAYAFILYFIVAIGVGIVSAFHVGMIFAYRIGNVKVEEQPKTFWVIAVLYAVVALSFIVYQFL